MTIDDIRKKLKQQQDYRANKVAEYRATLPQQQTSTWNAVQNRLLNENKTKLQQERIKQSKANILPKNQSTQPITNVQGAKEIKTPTKLGNAVNDVSKAVSNLLLGSKKAGESSLYYIDKISDVTGQRAEIDARNNYMQKLSQAKTPLERAKIELDTIEEINPTNPLLIKRNKDTQSAVEKQTTKWIEEDEQKIAENIESTSNKVARKVAELTPSIRTVCNWYGYRSNKSSIINGILANICWRRLY